MIGLDTLKLTIDYSPSSAQSTVLATGDTQSETVTFPDINYDKTLRIKIIAKNPIHNISFSSNYAQLNSVGSLIAPVINSSPVFVIIDGVQYDLIYNINSLNGDYLFNIVNNGLQFKKTEKELHSISGLSNTNFYPVNDNSYIRV